MEQLYFLDSKTRDLVEKMTRSYERIVTPNDFKEIASLMSEHLSEQVPILKDFTKFFGRLAEDFLKSAKPSNSAFDWKKIALKTALGDREKGYVLPDFVNIALGLKPGESISENLLKRFDSWKPNGTLSDIINGVESPASRRTGGKFFKVSYVSLNKDIAKKLRKTGKLELLTEKKIAEIELFYSNKLPKSWTNVPWVNFDGKVVEQNFTQVFEERLRYKDDNGNWVVNILQVPQKSEASWWDQVLNKDGKINDVADITKARTAYAVNGNHSNDATLVKKFHKRGS